jgi:hypothetical protein
MSARIPKRISDQEYKYALRFFFEAEDDLAEFKALPADERAGRFRELSDLAAEVEQRRKVARLHARQIYNLELPADWRPDREKYPFEARMVAERRAIDKAKRQRRER